MQPLSEHLHAPAIQEFTKGEAAGIALFVKLPELSVQELQRFVDDHPVKGKNDA